MDSLTGIFNPNFISEIEEGLLILEKSSIIVVFHLKSDFFAEICQQIHVFKLLFIKIEAWKCSSEAIVYCLHYEDIVLIILELEILIDARSSVEREREDRFSWYDGILHDPLDLRNEFLLFLGSWGQNRMLKEIFHSYCFYLCSLLLN